ncbi:M56 family metallopeptidase [Hufsiella ginkgonis]|uniref:Peptidase M56 domain-containing protein n=1 Tax=Hufsiella ginkgonis TaxID=2695274 RepID=A0A7K1XZD4_9SPHI|nr:M56 family metallopeptidase [Hufsiella ginkgonis]MXV16330.1 hypothetical protein [Hufsiella ginkgonis]
MPALFIYLLKVNIVLVLFYLAYRFILRPLTFYMLSRIFLVTGILFSTLYPLADLSWFVRENKALTPRLIVFIPDWQRHLPVITSPAADAAPVISYWFILQVIFWLGVAFMTVRLVMQLVSMYRVHLDSEPVMWRQFRFRKVNDPVSPFSFLRTIYLNTDQLQDSELEQVLVHERVHVREWHTADVLLAELSVIFYWFNPGVWLMKRAIRENLEFITDYRVIRSGTEPRTYQYSLLRIGTMQQVSPLASHFNLLTLKKRIIMMNKKRSSPVQAVKYLVMLPLVVALALVFTISKAQFAGKLTNPHKVMRSLEPVKAAENHVRSVTSIPRVTKTGAAVEKPAGPTDAVTVMKLPVEENAATLSADTLIRYMVDGKWVTSDEFKVIVPATIATVRVIDTKDAPLVFGDDPAHAGPVFFVVTKTNPNQEAVARYLEKARANDQEVISVKGYGTRSRGLTEPVQGVNITGQQVRDPNHEVVVTGYGIRSRGSAGSLRTNTVPGQEISAVSRNPGEGGAARVLESKRVSGMRYNGQLDGASFVIDGVPATQEQVRNLDVNKIQAVNVRKDTGKDGGKVFIIITRK